MCLPVCEVSTQASFLVLPQLLSFFWAAFSFCFAATHNVDTFYVEFYNLEVTLFVKKTQNNIPPNPDPVFFLTLQRRFNLQNPFSFSTLYISIKARELKD